MSKNMSMKFGSVAPRCTCCNERVYKLEELQVDKSILHKACFKCTHCKRLLSLSNFASVNGKFYCKTHFIELFHSAGGKYSVFGDGDFKKKESGAVKPPLAPVQQETKKEDLQETQAEQAEEPVDDDVQEKSKLPTLIPLVKPGSSWVNNSADDIDEDDLQDSPVSTEKKAADGKYMSLKDRLKQYEKNASMSKKPAAVLEPKRRSGSIESASSTATDENNDANIRTVTKSAVKFDESCEDFEYWKVQAMKLLETNKNLTLRADNLQHENETLRAKVARMKKDLAEQTAKAFESDEWCAKLSKDYEKIAGAPHPELARVLE